jgi:hypothetical protein
VVHVDHQDAQRFATDPAPAILRAAGEALVEEAAVRESRQAVIGGPIEEAPVALLELGRAAFGGLDLSRQAHQLARHLVVGAPEDVVHGRGAHAHVEMRKLGVRKTSGLVRIAIREGLLDA